METKMDTEPERRDSNARRRSGGSDGAMAVAVSDLPITVGATAFEEFESPTGKDDAQSRRMPRLRDYNLNVSWRVYVGAFLSSVMRQGICNYMTASGTVGEKQYILLAVIKATASFVTIGGAIWASGGVLGGPWASRFIKITSSVATTSYAIVFAINPMAAAITLLPVVFVATLFCMISSQRRCLAAVWVPLTAFVQITLTFIIQALPLVQSKLPETAQQFLVPALKTTYLGIVSEVLTLVWKKLYKRPCSPYPLTAILLVALVSAETMGVVGLLAAVDSSNPWSNAAIFCATTIVMETNSRCGIFLSVVFKLMGKKYRFSDAGHIFRWGKMWASYCWLVIFGGFVVPALILGLKVKDSNFTFLRIEVWALAGIYVLQQMATDFIYVYVQHYIRPSQTLSQTASRCLVLGEATPFSGENEHIGADGLQSDESPLEEEFEDASIKVGPWTITVEALVVSILFDLTASVWNNYVRGQFCIYGTFLPAEDGSCD